MRAGARVWLRSAAAGFWLLAGAGCGLGPRRIPTDADPVDLALDARGRYLYVACEGSRTVMTWDLQRNRRTAETEVAAGPLRIFLAQDNRTLHVLCEEGRRWFVLRAPELEPADERVLAFAPAAWCEVPYKSWDYLADAEGDRIIPHAGGDPLLPIPVGREPRALAFDPGREQIWVADFKEHALEAVHLLEHRAARRIPVRMNPRRLQLDAETNLLYALCTGRDDYPPASVVQLVDLNYQAAGMTLPAGRDARDFVLDPYRERALVANAEGLRIVTLAGGEGRQVKTGADPRAVAVSPDGRRAYVACREAQAVFIHRLGRSRR